MSMPVSATQPHIESSPNHFALQMEEMHTPHHARHVASSFLPILEHCRYGISITLHHGRMESRYTAVRTIILADAGSHRPLLLIRRTIEKVRIRHLSIHDEEILRDDLAEGPKRSVNDIDAMQHFYAHAFIRRPRP